MPLIAHDALYVADADLNMLYPGATAVLWQRVAVIPGRDPPDDTKPPMKWTLTHASAHIAQPAPQASANGALALQYNPGRIVHKFRIQRAGRYVYANELYPSQTIDVVACGFPLEEGDVIEIQGLTASLATAFTVSLTLNYIPGHIGGGHTPTPRGVGDRPWALRAITSADPAAGAEVSQSPPARGLWHLLNFKASLVTDITVVTRAPYLICLLGDAATETMRSLTGTQVASLTYSHTWSPVGQSMPGAGPHLGGPVPLPCYVYPDGYLRTSTYNIQAGDNWGVATIYVLERVVEGYAGEA